MQEGGINLDYWDELAVFFALRIVHDNDEYFAPPTIARSWYVFSTKYRLAYEQMFEGLGVPAFKYADGDHKLAVTAMKEYSKESPYSKEAWSDDDPLGRELTVTVVDVFDNRFTCKCTPRTRISNIHGPALLILDPAKLRRRSKLWIRDGQHLYTHKTLSDYNIFDDCEIDLY
jgi:hypothetical protein